MLKKFFAAFLIFLLSGGFSATGFSALGGFIWPRNTSAAGQGSPLRINEVAPSEASSQDWIEFYVAENGDYSNYVVKERTTIIKTFPSSFNLSAGDFVVLHINQTGIDETADKGSNGYWDLYSSDSGLTGTDNVIILENSSGNIIDAISFANNDGAWATSQQSAFNNAVTASQWTGTIKGGAAVNEPESADWSSGSEGSSLGRDETSTDTDNTAQAKNDWAKKSFQTMGSANIENEPPRILEAKASPSSAPADNETEVLFTAEISDPQGLSDVSSVSIDLSELDGDDIQAMYDDGTSGDVTSSDGIYSFKTTIPLSTPPENYNLAITVQDLAGNETTGNLTLDVINPIYSDGIIINEILPDPEGDDATAEFIELKNIGSESVNLKNWKVGDLSSTYTISLDDFTSTEIPAGGYFVIYRNISGIALNNTGGDQVKLFQPDGNLLDSVSYTGTAPEGQSYNFYNNSWSWSTTITPGRTNQITQLTVNDGNGGTDSDTAKVTISKEDQDEKNQDAPEGPFSSDVIINEILPNPEGSDNEGEFIELYNRGSQTVDLNLWQLDDEDGGSSPHTIENKSISAGQFLVLYRSETGLALNNDADSARLIHPDGEVTSKVTYSDSADENVAYARDTDDSWKWTVTPTPGAANIITAPENSEKDNNDSSSTSTSSGNNDDRETSVSLNEISIIDARGKEKNTQVKVRGIVTVDPKLLGKKIFYIQDSTAGIQIYFSKEDFPNLKLGDEVTVLGKTSESQNEKKINVQEKTDIQVTAHKSPPKPAEIKSGDLKENYEGELVQVAGKVAKSSGNVFYVNDGSGEAKIYIKKTTGIKKPEIKKDDKITVVGIASETSSGYRVLPRYQEDIKFGLLSKALGGNIPAAGRSFWFVVLFALTVTLYIELPRLVYKFQNEIKK
jgi:uncharacterized protein YdeI (BOF family)